MLLSFAFLIFAFHCRLQFFVFLICAYSNMTIEDIFDEYILHYERFIFSNNTLNWLFAIKIA